MQINYDFFQLPQQSLEYELKRILNSIDFKSQELNMEFNSWLMYCRGLVAYLSGDVVSLNNIIDDLERINGTNNISYIETVIEILKLRLMVRNKSLIEIKKKISIFESSTSLLIDKNYLGEFYFILARGYELLLNFEKAHENYILSSEHYKRQNLNKKYMKSIFNAMVISHHSTNTTNIDRYYKILKIAITERDRSIIGAVLLNLSFLLLFAGAYNSSLKICLKCIRFLKFEDKSLNYQLAKLNLAHIYYLLEYYNEFDHLIKELSKSTFPEIIAGIELLKTQNFSPKNGKTSFFSLSWLWRFHKKATSLAKLSQLEDKLLGYLILAPRTRSEIIFHLWSTRNKDETTIDRFKKIITRLKFKRPNSIFLKDSYYKLNIHEIDKINILRNTNTTFNLESTNLSNNTEILSGDELKLRNLLDSSNYSFYELIEKLYAADVSIDKLSNRLKNLIRRVRKKFPNRLHCREGRYYWI